VAAQRRSFLIAGLASLALLLAGTAALRIVGAQKAVTKIARTDSAEQSAPQREYVLITGGTSCHPVPVPNEKCPGAATKGEVAALAHTVDICAHGVFKTLMMTDSGFGYEAPSGRVSAAQFDCLRSRTPQKIEIKRVTYPDPLVVPGRQ